jgi:hypothetical protein
MQAIATADISLLMPQAAAVAGPLAGALPSPSVSPASRRMADPFRFFDGLRLQLCGAADALAAAAAEPRGVVPIRELQLRIRAILLLVSALLRETVRLVSCFQPPLQLSHYSTPTNAEGFGSVDLT